MVDTTINDKIFNVSMSPHIRDNQSIAKIMWTVIIALTPAALFSAFNFGYRVLMVLFIGMGSAVLFEYLTQKIRKKTITIRDGSACLTGLLLAMCLPPTIPFYMPAVGSFIAIVIAKHAMGGLGFNIFNPAHMGGRH